MKRKITKKTEIAVESSQSRDDMRDRGKDWKGIIWAILIGILVVMTGVLATVIRV